MRLLITASLEELPAAADLALEQAAQFARYTRIGWGWSFGPYKDGKARFFVRRLKDGLSVRQVHP